MNSLHNMRLELKKSKEGHSKKGQSSIQKT